MTFFTRKIYW